MKYEEFNKMFNEVVAESKANPHDERSWQEVIEDDMKKRGVDITDINTEDLIVKVDELNHNMEIYDVCCRKFTDAYCIAMAYIEKKAEAIKKW